MVRPGRDPIDAQRYRLQDSWSALNAELNVGEIRLGRIRDHKLTDNRYRILVIGEANVLRSRAGDLDFVSHVRLRKRSDYRGAHGTIQRLVKCSPCL